MTKQEKYMRMFDSGMSRTEIAKECGVWTSTVSRLIKLARKKEFVEEGQLTSEQKQYVLSLAANDMNISKTAQEFGIKYGTFFQRLKQIYRHTGLNPCCFYDLIKLVEMAKE